MRKQKFDVSGMSCSACSAAVERAVRKLGVERADVSLMTNTLAVTYDEGKTDDKQIIAAMSEAGYFARVQGEDGKSSAGPVTQMGDEQKVVRMRLMISIVCLVPLMTLSMGPMLGLPVPGVFEHNPMIMALTQFLLSLVVVIVNQKFYRVGFKALWHKNPNMDSLVAVGSGAAMAYGIWVMFHIASAMGAGDMEMAMHHSMDLYFESAATILTLITLGKYFEARSKGQTTDAIRKLLDLAPKTALVERDGGTVEVGVEQVRLGEVVVIRPGASVPVDGVIVSGHSSIDESALTGESMPVDKQAGDRVSAGTINKNGALRVTVERESKDTTLAQIVHLVEEAGASKAPIGRLADKISGVFVPVVIGIAILATVVWLIASGDVSFSLSIGISVLVISCPCALGLATPVSTMVGAGRAASMGVLFKSAEALETAHSIDAVVLDKTGTLTMGRPGVTDMMCAEGVSESQLLGLAAALEQQSEHPLAEAVVARAKAEGVSLGHVEGFEAVPGRGVMGNVDGAKALAGSAQMMAEHGVEVTAFDEAFTGWSGEGKTCLFFATGGKMVGVIAVADQVKPTSAQAIAEMKKMGIQPVMLTGDNKKVAAAVSIGLGIERFVAEVLPGDKEAEVRRLQGEGKKVMMVGDGINDAPALTRADLGVAIGAGTDVAIESADVVLMNSDPMGIVDALKVGRAVIRNIKQNLFWAFFYNTIGIPLAAGVFYAALGWKLNPMIAAAAMSLSSVCVVSNALRLRRVEKTATFEPMESVESCPVACPVEATEAERSDNGVKWVLKVEGMMCQNCVRHVTEALEKIEGVTATVSLEEGTANVSAPQSVTSEELKQAVEEQDYQVTSVERL